MQQSDHFVNSKCRYPNTERFADAQTYSLPWRRKWNTYMKNLCRCVPVPENATSLFREENLRLQLEKKQREVQVFDGLHAKLDADAVAQHADNCALTE